jgi:peptide deformylase
MGVMRILKLNHEALKTRCLPVTEFNDLIRLRLDIMWETMEKEGGIGLAANQIGFFNRMFVMKGEDGKRYDIINPEIMMRSESLFRIKEGCLSLPMVSIDTGVRSQEITVKFHDRDGKETFGVFTNIDAVCFQHEMEHLEGKSFLDHLNRAERRKIFKKYA